MSNLFLAATTFTISFLAGYFYNKNSNKKEIIKRSYELNDLAVLNLTPNNINLYDSEKKLLVSLKPEDPKIQLRLTSDENSDSTLCRIFSNNYENINRHPHVLESYDDWLGGHYISTSIPIKKPIEYKKIDGIDELRNLMKKNYSGYSIIVSSMVADYLIKNKSDYKNLCNHVLVPDTNPQNVVRNDKRTILGVTGLIDYGPLE
jgi:hypothetical protein